ncbi:MAG: hypothetical protein QGF18_04740 [Alphaproteobacteria bacterium]|nr:hypothetical protein [Alphaproteobacteria bacterium]MDP7183152.1 hypothetical protein [Alphaproteobacteria bacterium]MDP7191364.1 hypothetical protein [Alphaproteobacteria bacterium]HJO88466.1 hypothetical protein [Alphaproteobacteria bacterium]
MHRSGAIWRLCPVVEALADVTLSPSIYLAPETEQIERVCETLSGLETRVSRSHVVGYLHWGSSDQISFSC